MSESALQLLVLVRFLCFVAVIYLGLHIIFSRLISKADSKILWFFSIITSPLTWPVRAWLAPGTPESRLRFVALVFYVVLWVLILGRDGDGRRHAGLSGLRISPIAIFWTRVFPLARPEPQPKLGICRAKAQSMS